MPELASAVNFLKSKAWEHPKSDQKGIRVMPVTAAVDIPDVPLGALTSEQFTSIESKEPASGLYWVIGSFRSYGPALALVDDYKHLVPDILTARLGVKSVYRVVVGPIPEGQEGKVHRRASKAGLSDLWAIRIKAGDWFLARQLIDPNPNDISDIGEELARLPQRSNVSMR